jgi:type II secretory pathway pseudopilin PulG
MRPTRIARPAFTLIELVVSMTAGVVICAIAGSLIWNASIQRSETAARAELADLGGTALEVMLRYVREIRRDNCPSAPCGGSGNNKAQIGYAAAGELRFGEYGADQSIRIRKNGAYLELSIDSAANWRRLATDASALTFAYYNAVGTPLTALPLSATDRESVRRIQITMTLDRAGQSFSVRGSVYLRNFMAGVSP